MVFFRAHRFALAGAPRTRGKRHRKRQARRLRAGWTIQEIVFCVESALYDWLDRLSLSAAPKWHSVRVFIFRAFGTSEPGRKGAPRWNRGPGIATRVRD